MKHKHAELIKAWADGAEIEFLSNIGLGWCKCVENFSWYEGYEYRIKPEPKPDVVKYHWARYGGGQDIRLGSENLKLTFSGETGALIKAEVLK